MKLARAASQERESIRGAEARCVFPVRLKGKCRLRTCAGSSNAREEPDNLAALASPVSRTPGKIQQLVVKAPPVRRTTGKLPKLNMPPAAHEWYCHLLTRPSVGVQGVLNGLNSGLMLERQLKKKTPTSTRAYSNSTVKKCVKETTYRREES